jgi:hypothetical protein
MNTIETVYNELRSELVKIENTIRGVMSADCKDKYLVRKIKPTKAIDYSLYLSAEKLAELEMFARLQKVTIYRACFRIINSDFSLFIQFQ